jgi:hypothetical protein
MTAPFVMPFNFQPTSVSVKTGSYTIPSGKYARVSVALLGDSTFTIGGTTCLESKTWSVLSSDNLRLADGAATNALFTTVGNTGIGSTGGAFNENPAYGNASCSYFLPAGTVINGTGVWRAVVEEYFNIT